MSYRKDTRDGNTILCGIVLGWLLLGLAFGAAAFAAAWMWGRTA
jgi:hypothetical protein